MVFRHENCVWNVWIVIGHLLFENQTFNELLKVLVYKVRLLNAHHLDL